MWKVPECRNDLKPDTELRSVEHCQQIMAAIKKMHLVLCYYLHRRDPKAYIEKHMATVDDLSKQIVSIFFY